MDREDASQRQVLFQFHFILSILLWLLGDGWYCPFQKTYSKPTHFSPQILGLVRYSRSTRTFKIIKKNDQKGRVDVDLSTFRRVIGDKRLIYRLLRFSIMGWYWYHLPSPYIHLVSDGDLAKLWAWTLTGPIKCQKWLSPIQTNKSKKSGPNFRTFFTYFNQSKLN